MSLGGPKTTTTSNQNQQGSFNQQQQQQQQSQTQQQQTGLNVGHNVVTPNLPSYLANYYQQMPGQFNQLTGQLGQMAQTPLYGAPQQANYEQELNRQLGAAGQNLQSSLARSGALNSNRAADMQTALALGGAQQMGNYLAQTPLLNAQYKQGVLGQLGNTLTNFANWKPPVIGQTTDTSQLMNQIANALSSASGTSDASGQSQSSSQGTQTQQQSGGLLQSLLGGILNAGLGFATGGLSNVLGGGSFFHPQDATPVSDMPTTTASAMNLPYMNQPMQLGYAPGFNQALNQQWP